MTGSVAPKTSAEKYAAYVLHAFLTVSITTGFVDAVRIFFMNSSNFKIKSTFDFTTWVSKRQI